MMRRPPRSTQSRSSAASDVYKRQVLTHRGVRNLNARVADATGRADRLKVEQKASVFMLVEHHGRDLRKLVDPDDIGLVLPHECFVQPLDLCERGQFHVSRRDLIAQVPELDELRTEPIAIVEETDDTEQKDHDDKFDRNVPTHSGLLSPMSTSGSWSPWPAVPGPQRRWHMGSGSRRCAHP